MKRLFAFLLSPFYFCLSVAPAYAACTSLSACPAGQVCTALGCIPTAATDFTAWILARAMGLGGGIAFLLMVFGALKILTSAGNPEGIKAGGETITSALMGLVFLIFSLFLLHLIGVDILKIPGFQK